MLPLKKEERERTHRLKPSKFKFPVKINCQLSTVNSIGTIYVKEDKKALNEVVCNYNYFTGINYV